LTVKFEEIFLAYANNPIRDNPEIVYQIIKDFADSVFIEPEHEFFFPPLFGEQRKKTINALNEIAKHFVDLVKCNDLQISKKMRQTEIIKDADRYNPVFFEAAYRAVFHYNNGCPEDIRSCGYSERPRYLGVEQFTGQNRKKCYECHQLFFRYLLEGIVEGKEYSEIAGWSLILFLNESEHQFPPSVTINETSSKSPFKEELEKKAMFRPGLHESDFLFTFGGIIGKSLLEFLIQKDRRKLKHCPYCDNFFIAKSINRKTRCYLKDCEKAYQRDKKKKQREKNPEIYY